MTEKTASSPLGTAPLTVSRRSVLTMTLFVAPYKRNVGLGRQFTKRNWSSGVHCGSGGRLAGEGDDRGSGNNDMPTSDHVGTFENLASHAIQMRPGVAFAIPPFYFFLVRGIAVPSAGSMLQMDTAAGTADSLQKLHQTPPLAQHPLRGQQADKEQEEQPLAAADVGQLPLRLHFHLQLRRTVADFFQQRGELLGGQLIGKMIPADGSESDRESLGKQGDERGSLRPWPQTPPRPLPAQRSALRVPLPSFPADQVANPG